MYFLLYFHQNWFLSQCSSKFYFVSVLPADRVIYHTTHSSPTVTTPVNIPDLIEVLGKRKQTVISSNQNCEDFGKMILRRNTQKEVFT